MLLPPFVPAASAASPCCASTAFASPSATPTALAARRARTARSIICRTRSGCLQLFAVQREPMGTPLASPSGVSVEARGWARRTAAWYMSSACVMCTCCNRPRRAPSCGSTSCAGSACACGPRTSSRMSTRSASASSTAGALLATASSPSASSSSPAWPCEVASRKCNPRGLGKTRQWPPSRSQRASNVSSTACDLSRNAAGSNARTPNSRASRPLTAIAAASATRQRRSAR
mmetsp:Transcript_107089/g.341152  ORF Transcript_107089/g.341152 Transcript_107089/m.341152 type:complete len:232 (-) Transcript_107089:450-1145(-)